VSSDRGFRNALKTNKILQVGASKLVRRLYVGSVLENDRMAVTLIPRHNRRSDWDMITQSGLDWVTLFTTDLIPMWPEGGTNCYSPFSWSGPFKLGMNTGVVPKDTGFRLVRRTKIRYLCFLCLRSIFLINLPSILLEDLRSVPFIKEKGFQHRPDIRVPPMLTEDIRRVAIASDMAELEEFCGDRLSHEVVWQSIMAFLETWMGNATTLHDWFVL